MKQLIKYQCEICKQEYDSPEKADECEAKGKEIPLVELFENVECQYLIEEEVFWADLTVYEIRESGHYIDYALGTIYDEESDSVSYYPSESMYGNQALTQLCKWK